jgi:hypothetical protein
LEGISSGRRDRGRVTDDCSIPQGGLDQTSLGEERHTMTLMQGKRDDGYLGRHALGHDPQRRAQRY